MSTKTSQVKEKFGGTEGRYSNAFVCESAIIAASGEMA
jgi:hypothetical protein